MSESFLCCVILKLVLLVRTDGISYIDYEAGPWNIKDMQIHVADDEYPRWNSRCATIVVRLGGERPHSRAENRWILPP